MKNIKEIIIFFLIIAAIGSAAWCFLLRKANLEERLLREDTLFGETVLKKKAHEQLSRVQNEVEGLLFRYKHFYGTFNYVAVSRKWYRNEIRVIRNDKSIRSYRDAQGFRKGGRKLNVVPVDAEIYHYGWVRHPTFMQEKIEEVRKFYDGISEAEAIKKAGEQEFNYSSRYDALSKFDGTHPAVIKERIRRLNWQVNVDLSQIRMKPKYRLLHFIEKNFRVRLFEYRNYRIIKEK